jgi:hypothetical protein
LGDQLSEPTRTHNQNAVWGANPDLFLDLKSGGQRNAVWGANPDLFLDLKSGGQRFCEHGGVIGYRIRYRN